MKYFTPELYQRLQSLDDDRADAADDDWEEAIKRYRRRLAKMLPALPEGVQRFRKDRVCLHDARLWSIGRQGDTFVMVLQPEPPAQTMVVLTFTLDGEPVIDKAAVPDHQNSDWVEWMYEEWDGDRHRRCWFEVLLSNGWSVRLPFRDFHYLIGQRLFPDPQAAPAPAPPKTKPPVPQSA
jgi:hypothetical protein